METRKQATSPDGQNPENPEKFEIFPESMPILPIVQTGEEISQNENPIMPLSTQILSHAAEQNPTNQTDLDYYEEYKKIYLISYHLYTQKIKHIESKNELERRLKAIEDKMKDLQRQEAPKKENTSEENRIKRSRRTAQQIQRRFKCTVEYCERCYGSEGSLQQHIKLKHPQLYKKTYDSDKESFVFFGSAFRDKESLSQQNENKSSAINK